MNNRFTYFFLYMLFTSPNVSIKLIYYNLLETLHDLQEGNRDLRLKFMQKPIFLTASRGTMKL